jgi:hypothetical protein
MIRAMYCIALRRKDPHVLCGITEYRRDMFCVTVRTEEIMTFISTVVISTMFCVALERLEEMFCGAV